MAVRTDDTAVKTVLLRDYDTRNLPSLTAFIDTASAIVDRVATCAALKGKSLTTGELELVERWLAAHCYAQSDKTYASRSTAGASGSFDGKTDMGFDSTLYGQTAMRIDYSGCLTAINKRQVAGAVWLGKPPSDQIAYVDRS